MNKSLSLLGSFLKIGLFTLGGGYAMIPLIEREVIDRKRWVAREEFLELLTLGQSAPGPIALNTAVFVGYRVAGYRGMLCAVAGIVVPAFVIILLVALFFSSIRENRVVEAVFKGVRPAVVALILAPVFNLSKGLGIWRGLLAVAAAAVVWHFGVSPIYLIVIGAVGGIAYGVVGGCRKIPKRASDTTPSLQREEKESEEPTLFSERASTERVDDRLSDKTKRP